MPAEMSSLRCILIALDKLTLKNGTVFYYIAEQDSVIPTSGDR